MERIKFNFLNNIWIKTNKKNNNQLKIWTIGTDFFLLIGRWFNLIKCLLQVKKNNLDKLMIYSFCFQKNNESKCIKYKLKIENQTTKKLVFDNLSFNTKKNTKYDLHRSKNAIGMSTVKQFFQVGEAIDLIHSDNKINYFSKNIGLLEEWTKKFEWINDENKCFNTSIWFLEKLFQEKLKSLNIIIFSIFFSFVIAKYGVKNLIDYFIEDEVKHINFVRNSLEISDKNEKLFFRLVHHGSIEPFPKNTKNGNKIQVKGTQISVMNIIKNYKNDKENQNYLKLEKLVFNFLKSYLKS